MLRILHCVNNMHRAGLETMLMNYYRNIDRSKLQFDFLMHREERSDYDDEIEAMGGKIYRAPRLYPQNYPAYFRYMKDFFSEHPEYKIVHSHIDAMSYLPLKAAKKAGVPIRIAHSHSTGIDLDFKYPLKQYFRFCLGNVTSHSFACGQEAGKFLFCGRDFSVIPNAVDSVRFAFCDEIRQKKREELSLTDCFVVGHVGRMAYAKNHSFLIDIFSSLLKSCHNAVLMLVGAGEKEDELKAKVKALGIGSSVLFLGNRSDVDELYQAMDVFVLPSKFEGVPVVGIEAQFSGLPCIFSDRVPKEVGFGKNCVFQKLGDPAQKWAESILSLAAQTDRNAVVECPLFDIRLAAQELQTDYNELLKVLYEK